MSEDTEEFIEDNLEKLQRHFRVGEDGDVDLDILRNERRRRKNKKDPRKDKLEEQEDLGEEENENKNRRGEKRDKRPRLGDQLEESLAPVPPEQIPPVVAESGVAEKGTTSSDEDRIRELLKQEDLLELLSFVRTGTPEQKKWAEEKLSKLGRETVKRLFAATERGKSEEKNNEKFVWYEGIVEDLVAISLPNENLNDEDLEKRRKVAQRLRDKGIRLPPLSTDKEDKPAFLNRQQLNGAVEYLNPLFSGEFRNKAIHYLENMGIGNRAGVDCLPGSVEDRKKEMGKQQRLDYIRTCLADLGGTADKEKYAAAIDKLEEAGVGIKEFIVNIEAVAPGKLNDLMIQLQAVTKIWSMNEDERKKYPVMTGIAKLYEKALGLG